VRCTEVGMESGIKFINNLIISFFQKYPEISISLREICQQSIKHEDADKVSIFVKSEYPTEEVFHELATDGKVKEAEFLLNHIMTLKPLEVTSILLDILERKSTSGMKIMMNVNKEALLFHLKTLIKKKDVPNLSLYVQAGFSLDSIVNQYVENKKIEELDDQSMDELKGIFSAGYKINELMEQYINKSKHLEDECKYLQSLMILIKAGADIDETVCKAIQLNDQRIMEVLLSAGVGPNLLRFMVMAADPKKVLSDFWFEFFSRYDVKLFSGDGRGVFNKSNTRYEGSWKNGKADGQGIMYVEDPIHQRNSYKYEGSFKEGKMDGAGTVTYKNGKRFSAVWKDGKIMKRENGDWDLINEFGDRIEFNFGSDKDEDSKALGKGYYVGGNRNQSCRYEGEFQAGKRSGKGTAIYSNEERYEGDWLFDKRHGRGIQTFKLSANSCAAYKYDGEWHHDSEHGQGRLIDQAGNSILQGKFKEGVIWEGKGFHQFENKDRFEGIWLMGSIVGEGAYTFFIRPGPGRVDENHLVYQENQLSSAHHDCCVLVLKEFPTRQRQALNAQIRERGDQSHEDLCNIALPDMDCLLRCSLCNCGISRGYACQSQSFYLCEACGLPDTFWNKSCRNSILRYVQEKRIDLSSVINDKGQENEEAPMYTHLNQNEVRLQCNWICGVPSGPGKLLFPDKREKQVVWTQAGLRVYEM